MKPLSYNAEHFVDLAGLNMPDDCGADTRRAA
jgi:hypothetical protein